MGAMPSCSTGCFGSVVHVCPPSVLRVRTKSQDSDLPSRAYMYTTSGFEGARTNQKRAQYWLSIVVQACPPSTLRSNPVKVVTSIVSVLRGSIDRSPAEAGSGTLSQI